MLPKQKKMPKQLIGKSLWHLAYIYWGLNVKGLVPWITSFSVWRVTSFDFYVALHLLDMLLGHLRQSDSQYTVVDSG